VCRASRADGLSSRRRTAAVGVFAGYLHGHVVLQHDRDVSVPEVAKRSRSHGRHRLIGRFTLSMGQHSQPPGPQVVFGAGGRVCAPSSQPRGPSCSALSTGASPARSAQRPSRPAGENSTLAHGRLIVAR
jgi:hypothetical protein